MTTGGRLEYLVNNSGILISISLRDVPLDDAKGLFDTNLWDALNVIEAFSPLLIRDKGTILNISSVTSYMHVPWEGVYVISKAALNVLGETLQLELSTFGVEVLTVISGAVNTKICDNCSGRNAIGKLGLQSFSSENREADSEQGLRRPVPLLDAS
ncbi:hypothetical protein BJX96DRAFT_180829 [Aspergillus floccosus]